MIEMRWKRLNPDEEIPPYALKCSRMLLTEYKVLQFRLKPTGEFFHEMPDYEWKDVENAPL